MNPATSNTNNNTALLGNNGGMAYFSFADQTIRFRVSDRLERFAEVKEWDNGYIVVTARYKGLGDIEEYIDLQPILHNLYINADEFLHPIKQIRIDHDKKE